MKANATSRVPDCFQKLPRRVNIPENGSQILSIAVDGQGIVILLLTKHHFVQLRDDKVNYQINRLIYFK